MAGIRPRAKVPADACIKVAEKAALAGIEVGADSAFVDYRGLIAGPEARHINRISIRTHGQRAWSVGEEAHDLERRAAQRVPGIRRIKDPNIGARHTRSCELWIACAGNAGN